MITKLSAKPTDIRSQLPTQITDLRAKTTDRRSHLPTMITKLGPQSTHLSPQATDLSPGADDLATKLGSDSGELTSQFHAHQGEFAREVLLGDGFFGFTRREL